MPSSHSIRARTDAPHDSPHSTRLYRNLTTRGRAWLVTVHRRVVRSSALTGVNVAFRAFLAFSARLALAGIRVAVSQTRPGGSEIEFETTETLREGLTDALDDSGYSARAVAARAGRAHRRGADSPAARRGAGNLRD